MTGERKLFKDWFDRSAAQALGHQCRKVYRSFPEDTFITEATQHLEKLEFHDRIRQFSKALRQALPPSIPDSLKILQDSLPEPSPEDSVIKDGWLQWPVGQFIADYGVPQLDLSFAAMVALTQVFSAEFAIRPFLQEYPEEVFSRLQKLTAHPNHHVRRWCSEGIRPRLPWGKRLEFLIHDPSPIWPILERLKDDPSEYVRRSVGNNLNDIAKDHPDLVVEHCRNWWRESNRSRRQVIERGLRTLVKSGHDPALALLGYTMPCGINGCLQVRPAKASIGSHLELFATLTNRSMQNRDLVVDFRVHFLRKHPLPYPKVFKWKRISIDPGDTITLRKHLPLKQTSTRTLQPGCHLIELQVNGHLLAKSSFRLIENSGDQESAG